MACKLSVLLLLAAFPFAAGASAQAPPTPATPASSPTQSGSDPAGASKGSPQTTVPAQPQGTAPGAQKNSDGTYTIRTNARLVVLDIVVTDKQGNLVPNLTRNDFHVTEAGEPESIRNFEVARSLTPAADAVIDSTADLDRLAPRAPVNLIVLDEFNTRFQDEAFARYSLKRYLASQPDRLNAPTMLIAVDLQRFMVLRDYTQNKSEILAALDHHLQAYPWQAEQGAWIAERYAQAFNTLTRVSEATVGHIGHKNLIWIGRGFPTFPRSTNLDSETLVETAMQRCVNSLRDARITLYTIDPAGLNGPNTYSIRSEDAFFGNYQFAALAKATGGQTIYNRNDVDVQIATAARDGENFYTLTYRPESTSLDPNKFRRIKITFDRPDLIAMTREGYYLERRPGRVDPQNPSRRLRNDLALANTSTMAYDGVPMTLTPSPTDPNAYTVHVDHRGLNWSRATDTEPRHAELIFLVTTFDKKGKQLSELGKNIIVKAPATVEPTGRIERSIDLVYKIEPNPKAVRARFVVRVAATGRIGTADVILGSGAAVSTVPSSAPTTSAPAPPAPATPAPTTP